MEDKSKCEYRIHITVRRKGESIADSREIKTEHCDSSDELYTNAVEFIEETINTLEEGSDE